MDFVLMVAKLPCEHPYRKHTEWLQEHNPQMIGVGYPDERDCEQCVPCVARIATRDKVTA